MRTAIVYYSMSGNTKYVADKIVGRLRTSGEVDVIRIEPVKAYPDQGSKKFIWFSWMSSIYGSITLFLYKNKNTTWSFRRVCSPD